MNDTLNFYEILELDPSISVDGQKGKIETTINTKKREWSRERRPHKRARAQLARSVQRMLGTLSSDPDLWRRHARERLKQINAKEAEAQRLYRDFCDVYGKKSIYESFIMVFRKIGYIEPDQLDSLVGKAVHDSGANESTVRGCFKQLLEHHEIKTIEGATERSHIPICPYCGQFNNESAPRRRVAERAVGAVFRDALKGGGKGPEMVVLPTGRFRMGDLDGSGEKNERPVHTVTISRRIAMGQYPVTFEDYDRYVSAMGAERPYDEGWGRGSRPVIYVNWHDAQAYAAWLSKQTGKRYRLPSESEWEYAARAGTETAYSWGNEIGVNRANCNGCGSRWDDKQTSPVGSFEPNAFGLYDMHGNVWEWVEDCWHSNYEGAPSDGSVWTSGGDSSWAVVRGGSWFYNPQYLRAAFRGGDSPSVRNSDDGFRLVQDLNP